MFLLNWLKQWKEIKTEYRVCESCETLKMQLAIANQEKKDLLNRLLNPTNSLEPPTTEIPRAIPPTRHLSWNTRRQILEREDREAAKMLAQNKESNERVVKTDVDELEREMNIAAATREATTGKENN